jgi:phosphoribosylglycinamide formyltransferase-1
MYDRELVQLIRKYSPDLTVLAGFMRVLTPVFTENIRALNLHPSLLPRHRGLHAIERSWEDEYPEGGVSVHWVSSELDGGEIVLQKGISKKGHDRDSYSRAVRSMEKELLAEAIRNVLEISQDSCDITP